MNRGFCVLLMLCICHSVAYTATIHRFTRTSVLELGKATLPQILLPNNIYRLNIILMQNSNYLQSLLLTDTSSTGLFLPLCGIIRTNMASPKYGNVLHRLSGRMYLLSLTQWKKKNEGIYFIEAAPDTISVISSMFRYWLVDEIILFVAPYIQGDGIRLFTEIPGPSSWEMTGNKCFRSGICRLPYKRIE